MGPGIWLGRSLGSRTESNSVLLNKHRIKMTPYDLSLKNISVHSRSLSEKLLLAGGGK